MDLGPDVQYYDGAWYMYFSASPNSAAFRLVASHPVCLTVTPVSVTHRFSSFT